MALRAHLCPSGRASYFLIGSCDYDTGAQPAFARLGGRESGKLGKGRSLARLPTQRLRPKLQMQTERPALVANPGASPGVSLGSQRRASSKGQTRCEAGTQSYGPLASASGRQAAEGMGRRRARPSPSPPLTGVWTRPLIRGLDLPVTPRLALLFKTSSLPR
jgi:hypothetical protein